jgi:hypothetical protein
MNNKRRIARAPSLGAIVMVLIMPEKVCFLTFDSPISGSSNFLN